MGVRPAAGGGRWVEVAPDRLARWLAGFAERHGMADVASLASGLWVSSADGTEATFELPFGWPGEPGADTDALVAAAVAPYRFGLLLARQGGTAAGIVADGVLGEAGVDRRYVQGRTAAGGWSQQRYSRRRDNQARAAARSAADLVAGLLLPASATLAGVVTGGDRRAVDAVLADPRLAPLRDRRAARFLQVAEPRRAALEAAVPAARAVRVRLVDPERPPSG